MQVATEIHPRVRHILSWTFFPQKRKFVVTDERMGTQFNTGKLPLGELANNSVVMYLTGSALLLNFTGMYIPNQKQKKEDRFSSDKVHIKEIYLFGLFWFI